MSSRSFWDQELERDSYWLFQHLSNTCFTLTAVSFASLFGIFAIPAFRGSVPPVATSLLLVAGALLAFAGEMAREAYFLWKVLAAEAAYTVGLALLLVSYVIFAYSQSEILANSTVVITIIGLVILFLCWRMVHNIRVLQRHVKSMSKEDDRQKKKTSEFVNLVNADPRLDIEDLRLFLNLKMELFGQMWLFGMGLLVSLLAIDLAIPENPPYGTVSKLGIAGVTVGLYIFLISRKADPEKNMRKILQESDYLDAKEILLSRKETRSDKDRV